MSSTQADVQTQLRTHTHAYLSTVARPAAVPCCGAAMLPLVAACAGYASPERLLPTLGRATPRRVGVEHAPLGPRVSSCGVAARVRSVTNARVLCDGCVEGVVGVRASVCTCVDQQWRSSFSTTCGRLRRCRSLSRARQLGCLGGNPHRCQLQAPSHAEAIRERDPVRHDSN